MNVITSIIFIIHFGCSESIDAVIITEKRKRGMHMKKRFALLTIILLMLLSIVAAAEATFAAEVNSDVTKKFNDLQSYIQRYGVADGQYKALKKTTSALEVKIISVKDGQINFFLKTDSGKTQHTIKLWLYRNKLEDTLIDYTCWSDAGTVGSLFYSLWAEARIDAPLYKEGDPLNFTITSLSFETYRSLSEQLLEESVPELFDATVKAWDSLLESTAGLKMIDIGLGCGYEDPYVEVADINLDTTSTKMLTATSDRLPGQNESVLELTASITPSNATNQEVTWTSSDKSVATVDSSGRVKGLKPGTVTITATSEDGGKKAFCKVQVMSRKEVQLKAGAVYVFQSKLSNNYSMDVMYQNYATNTNVSLYTANKSRGAQRFTIEKKVVNGKAWWMLTRKNSTVGKRAVTELKGKNLVFGVNKGTNWQLFRAYKFNDGTVQFINRGSNNAITVVGGKAVNRANIAPIKADLSNSQRWKCVVVG